MDEHQPARMNLDRQSRAQARYESGMEYVNRGRHESAARSFTRAIRLDRDNNAQYRYMRGLVYFHLGRYDSAISDFRDAIARDTAHAKVHTYLGGAYQWSLSTGSLSNATSKQSALMPDTRKPTSVLRPSVHFWAIGVERTESWVYQRNSRQQ